MLQLNKDKSAFQKMFVQDVRKCEDMLRIIRYLKGEMAEVGSVLVAPVFARPHQSDSE